jgi:hypothetical protein
VSDTLEDTRLEESILFNESECESQHKNVPVCSETVTHRLVFRNHHELDINVCANVAAFFEREVARATRIGMPCALCRRPVAECWSKVPI